MFRSRQRKSRDTSPWLGSFSLYNRIRPSGARRNGQPIEYCSAASLPSSRLPSDHVGADQLGANPVTKAKPSPRCLLWVDAVGGFLVCFADEVVLGQAVPRNDVDVPILGDLSRRHVAVRREGDGYVIHPKGWVLVEGHEIQRPTVLADGDEIQLGESVKIRFRQPHVLSATARLDFLTNHRTQPSADAVVLMADSCILGPGMRNHVICRNWVGDVVLFRSQGDQLQCRAGGTFEIDGKKYSGQGPITRSSRITGTDFALSLEDM